MFLIKQLISKRRRDAPSHIVRARLEKKIMRKKINTMISMMLLALVFVSGAAGVYANSQEVISNVDTGVVNIEISEYTLNENGEEIPWVDNISVTPGMTISKRPYFTATGNNCYIRAKIEIIGVVDEATPITNESFQGISNDWIKVGDYYYYQYPVKTNEKVAFFNSFEIPSDWDNSVNPANIGDWGFSVKVTVDAVQAENFHPDFESESPWGDVVIQESIHKDGYDVNTFTTNSETEMFIVVEDNDDIIVDPDDFFAGFKTMVPGDELADSVEIDSKQHCKLYFTTESLEDVDLLQKLKLTISLTKDGEEVVIYDGVLDSQINDMFLGEFKKGEKGTLAFTISMPKELDNEYTLRNGSVKWVFRTEPVNQSNGPQTGDNVPLIFYICLMVMSGVGLITMAIIQYKSRKVEKNEEENR